MSAPLTVLFFDHHRLLLDSLGRWFEQNSAGISLVDCLTEGGRNDGGRAAAAPSAPEADAAVVGELADEAPQEALVSALAAKGIPVVVLLRRPVPEQCHALLAAGASALVPKAAEPEVLVSALRHTAGGGVFLHPHIAQLLAEAAPARVPLSEGERRILAMYLGPDAMPLKEVALALGLSGQTVKSHLRRVRQRYAAEGIDVGNVIAFKQQLRRDGWLE